MSFSKLNCGQLPSLLTIEKGISDVQNARFQWESVCSNEMLTFLDSHAKSMGVPKEFLFFPLLTTVASLMGTSTYIEINKKRREPALLWFVIVDASFNVSSEWHFSWLLTFRCSLNFHIRKSYAMQLLFFIVKLLSSDLNGSNCRIPCHIDHWLTVLLKTVATRYAVQSKFKTERFLEAGYAVRGEKLIQVSELSLELATRYAVRGG